MITIYDKTGEEIIQIPITEQSTRKYQLMEDNYVLLVFSLPQYIDFKKGSYIVYEENVFRIFRNVYPEQDTKKGGWKYEIYFDGAEGYLRKYNIFYRKQGVQEVVFSLTTNLFTHAQVVADCINYELGTSGWIVKAVSEELSGSTKLISYKGEKLDEALTRIAETFDCEWWLEVNGETVHICFGKQEFGTEEEFKVGDVVSSIPRRKGDDSNYGTRFFCYGSNRNLSSSYGQVPQGGTTNHISEIRLRLPDGIPYIDAWDNLAEEDIIHQIAFFEDIYPKNTETITGIETVKRNIENSSEKFDAYVMVVAGTPFTPDDMIEGQTLGCYFESGDLQGWKFELYVNEKNFDKKFEIIHQTLGEGDSQIIIPNASLCSKPGDQFILTGVNLPEERIREAEEELLKAAKTWAIKNSQDTDVYDCPTNPVYCATHDKEYEVGQKIRLIDARFGNEGRLSRIQGFEKKLYNPYIATYTVGDNTAYSRLASIESDIKEAQYADRLGVNGAGVYLIRSKYDATTPTDYNAYSALRSSVEYLHKNRIDIAQKLLTFLEGAKFGDFISGPLGDGAYIDNHGNGEMTSLTLRAFLEAPEFRYNRIQVVGGELYATNGSLISDVQEEDGSYLITLKIEEGDHVPFMVDDILLGSYLQPDGFFSSYMRIIHIDDAAHTIRCVLGEDSEVPGGINRPPVPFMNLVQYGNFTDKTRQSSIRISSKDKVITMLDGVNTYITGKEHITFGVGAAKNFPLDENLPINWGQSYLYARGIAAQDLIPIDYQGKVQQKIIDRSLWSFEIATSEEPYLCNGIEIHEVWHNSCKYQCIVNETTEEPRWNSKHWVLISGDTRLTMKVESSEGLLFRPSGLNTTLKATVYMGSNDVSSDIEDIDWSWSRDSGNVISDTAWNAAHASNTNTVTLTLSDMGDNWIENRSVKFTCTAYVRDGDIVDSINHAITYNL